MRKILLAATAMAAMTGAAFAQEPAPTVNTGVNSWVSAWGSSVPGPTNEPGSVKAFLRGRLWVEAAINSDSGFNGTGGKNGNIVFGEFARLYPSFEGVTANGLKYGAFIEVRQNSGGAGPSGLTGGNTMIFRRETGYVGGSWGALRFGQTDGALGLFQTGTFENFGENWNNDLPAYFTAGAVVTWPFPENSGNYGDSKIVYLSPNFAGFDFGASFSPNTSTSSLGNQTTAGAGSPQLSSLGAATFASSQSSMLRNRNTLELTGRYQGNVGPVGLTAMVGTAIAGNVKGNPTGLTANGSAPYKYKDVFAINAGLTAAIGGFAFGGDLWTGAINPNGSRNTQPVKAGGKNALAFVLGGSYATGPWIVGASYLSVNRQGFNTEDLAGATDANTGRMNEKGVAVGGTYAWGPGAALSLSYLYGERHQRGVNLYTGTSSAVGNNTHAQGVLLTQFFQW